MSKSYDKRDDFEFDIVNFHFQMLIFLVRHTMVLIFLNLFDLLECPIMLKALILVKSFDSKTFRTRI